MDEESKVQNKAFRLAFENDYKDYNGLIFNRAVNNIKQCKSDWKNRTIYAPIVIICQ